LFFLYVVGPSVFVFDFTANAIVDLRSPSLLQCVQGNNPRSISFMMQTTYTGCSVILSTGSTASSGMFGIGFSCGDVNTGSIQVYSDGNVQYIPTTGKAINDGLWHTVLVTYDGTTLNIYVDGILDNTATNWNRDSTATIASTLNTIGNSGNYLGQFVDGSNCRWSGKLKNVLFYDYVVTNSYVLANSYQAAGSILYTSGYFNLFIYLLTHAYTHICYTLEHALLFIL